MRTTRIACRYVKPPLSPEQIELIRNWIQTGLRESADSKSLAVARDTSFKPSGPARPKSVPAPMPENLPAFTPPVTTRPLPVIAMAASPLAPLLAVAGQEQVSLVDLSTRQTIGALAFPEGQPNVIRFSPDGRVLMVAGGKPVQSGSVVLS